MIVLGGICFVFWVGVYFITSASPSASSHQPASSYSKLAEKSRFLSQAFDAAQKKINNQMKTNSLLLNKLRLLKSQISNNNQAEVNIESFIELLEDPDDVNVDDLVKIVERNKPKQRLEEEDPLIDNAFEDDEEDKDDAIVNQDHDNVNDDDIEEVDNNVGQSKPIIPVLLFACNRVTVNKALDLLISYRPSKEQFPIIVSQDCNHQETRSVIQSYGDQIIYIQQPDQTEPRLPEKEKKFKGYFKIARHYGWALNHTMMELNFDQVIIVEDDLEISPDFYEYFSATLPLLYSDPSLWCVSAWNDNGKAGLINQTAPELLYR